MCSNILLVLQSFKLSISFWLITFCKPKEQKLGVNDNMDRGWTSWFSALRSPRWTVAKVVAMDHPGGTMALCTEFKPGMARKMWPKTQTTRVKSQEKEFGEFRFLFSNVTKTRQSFFWYKKSYAFWIHNYQLFPKLMWLIISIAKIINLIWSSMMYKPCWLYSLVKSNKIIMLNGTTFWWI